MDKAYTIAEMIAAHGYLVSQDDIGRVAYVIRQALQGPAESAPASREEDVLDLGEPDHIAHDDNPLAVLKERNALRAQLAAERERAKAEKHKMLWDWKADTERIEDQLKAIYLPKIEKAEGETKAFVKIIVNSDAWVAPCPICNYNGPGWYQPETHKCAAFRDISARMKEGGTR